MKSNKKNKKKNGAPAVCGWAPVHRKLWYISNELEGHHRADLSQCLSEPGGTRLVTRSWNKQVFVRKKMTGCSVCNTM